MKCLTSYNYIRGSYFLHRRAHLLLASKFRGIAVVGASSYSKRLMSASILVRGTEAASAVLDAEEALQSIPTSLPESSFVVVGDLIDTDAQEGFLRGHGTQVVDGQLRATVCGVIERVNKLVSVRPMRERYTAELGDVVVGRITEIVAKRWKVDLHSRQEASLMLSAVNLPGGIQRRRTMEDELNMRTLYDAGDLISAEVQSLFADGSIALHTRSLKYGKLLGGQMVTVPASLIRRQKQHFNTLTAAGVDVILGVNGWVWVSVHRAVPTEEEDAEQKSAPIEVLPWHREQICQVANAVRVLAALNFHIYMAPITDVYQASINGNVAVKDMLEPAFLATIVTREVQRRLDEMGSSCREVHKRVGVLHRDVS